MALQSIEREETMTFKSGEFISWKSTDGDEQVAHVGQVLSHKNGTIEMTFGMNGSSISIPEDDGTFTKARKPKAWVADAVKRERKPRSDRGLGSLATKTVKRVKRTPGGKTKVELIIELFRETGAPESRKDAIARIVEAGITTQAGASTFWAKIKRDCAQAISDDAGAQ